MKTITQLETERAERKDELDLPLSMTRREADAYLSQNAQLDGCLIHARSATALLAQLEGKVAPDRSWCDFLTKTRDRLCHVLLDLSSAPRGRVTWDREHLLKFAIVTIDRGCECFPNGAKMIPKPLADAIEDAGYTHEPGPYWAGSLPEVEGRIADMKVRLDNARAQLDEALLDDDARAKRDAEGAARVATLNAAPVRKVRGDHSQYDRYPDGRVVEVTS